MAGRGRPLRVFSVDEIKQITLHYANHIGRGANANVFKGELHYMDVAVKCYRVPIIESQFQNEINIYQTFNHPNILKLIGVNERNHELVLEYAPRSLRTEIEGPNELTITRILAIAKQVALAIQHMTGQNIVNGDISADNILLDERDQVKLADFGGAACIGQMINVYNKQYSAPEIINEGKSTATSDVYSLGVIIVQLITRQATEDLGNVPKTPKYLRNHTQGSTGKKNKKEKGQSSKANEVSHVSIQTEQAIRTQRYNIHPSISGANQENGRVARALIELANTCMNFHANQRPRIQDVIQKLDEL